MELFHTHTTLESVDILQMKGKFKQQLIIMHSSRKIIASNKIFYIVGDFTYGRSCPKPLTDDLSKLNYYRVKSNCKTDLHRTRKVGSS